MIHEFLSNTSKLKTKQYSNYLLFLIIVILLMYDGTNTVLTIYTSGKNKGDRMH